MPRSPLGPHHADRIRDGILRAHQEAEPTCDGTLDEFGAGYTKNGRLKMVAGCLDCDKGWEFTLSNEQAAAEGFVIRTP